MKWCLIYFAAFRVGLRELKLPKILADCSTAALPFVIEVEVGISSCAKFHHGASDFLRIGAVGFDNNRRNAQRQCRLRSFSRSIRRFAIGQGDRRTVRGELPHDRGSDAP